MCPYGAQRVRTKLGPVRAALRRSKLRHPRESGDPARGVSISPGRAVMRRNCERHRKIGWILFQPSSEPRTQVRGRSILSGCFRKPRVTAWLPDRLGATRDRRERVNKSARQRRMQLPVRAEALEAWTASEVELRLGPTCRSARDPEPWCHSRGWIPAFARMTAFCASNRSGLFTASESPPPAFASAGMRE